MEQTDLIVLPLSNDAYKVNSNGEIFSLHGHKLPIIRIGGIDFIRLSWINGDDFYKVNVVLAVAIFDIKIPKERLDDIELIFEDGDLNNKKINNLSYYFKNGPIEVHGLPGYFYIPYYTRYCINKEGVIIIIKTKYIKSWCKSSPVRIKNITGGYMTSRGLRDIGGVDHITRHRALALTFIPYKKNPWSMVINHIDGVPGNDLLNNLEWVTRAENNQHAYDLGLFPNKTVKVLMKNLVTGCIKKYSSIAHCARENNFSEGFIRARLRNSNIRYSDNISFKLDDNSDWPLDFLAARSPSSRRDIISKNIIDGKISIYSSASSASIDTNISDATILSHCKEAKKKTANGIIFRFLEKNLIWPEFSDEEIEKISMNLHS